MLHCPTCGKEYSEDFRFCPQDNTPLQAAATNVMAAPVDPMVGRTLDDKYLIEARLGIGGMGTVYRARHLLIDRAVAVKILNQRFVEDEAAKARFRREAKAAGRLQHSNAVGVTDFGHTPDGYVYIVMELLEGKNLRDVLAREAPLEVARAVSIMLQVSSAVAAAHEAGIIHRDLKPANIFIVQRSDVPSLVKVLDFGIAKLAADSLDDEDRLTLTQVGTMIGTPRYMSPEQCNSSPLTPAADVYSLGVILYEMLTGVVPFSGSTPLAIALKHSTEPPRRPSEFVNSIPPDLEEVVLHALEKNPEDRPADASAFRQELHDTAERLGFEHANVATAPSIAALRNAGTESPSGRLVVDLGRLRENRASTSGAEFAAFDTGEAETIAQSTVARETMVANEGGASRPNVPRLNVKVAGARAGWSRKPAIAAGLVSIILLTGVAIFVARSRGTATAPDANVVAPPSPTASPSAPSAEGSPSASPAPKEQRHTQKRTTEKKKEESPVRQILNQINPFKKKKSE